MPTIAVVANSSWNIYNFRLPLLMAFKQAGYRVLIVASEDEYTPLISEHSYSRFIPLRRLSAQQKNPVRDIFFLRELYYIYQEERPDLILHFTIKPNIYGSLAAHWAGIKSIPTITGLGYAFMHSSLLSHLARRMYKIAMSKVALALFHNTTDQDFFHEHNILDKRFSEVVPGSGVDTGYFRPLARPANDKFVFLFLGRLLADKGIREYAEAAKQLKSVAPKAECWVVGGLDTGHSTSISESQLRNWQENYGIHYYGNTLDVRPYLQQAHALVLPSYREGMPRAILEALAMGRPVITTDTAGCRESIDERCGMLVPPKDSLRLAEAMVQLYHCDEQLLEAMGKAARRRALEQFDDKIIVAQYLKICRALLHSPRPERIEAKAV
jgi:glycosyltransferase involved in cell wall biosynthesis